MMIEEKETLIDLDGEIVQETDDDQRIEMIAGGVVIEIIEVGEKTPESATVNEETTLLTPDGRLGEKTVGTGLLSKHLRISLVRLVHHVSITLLAK